MSLLYKLTYFNAPDTCVPPTSWKVRKQIDVPVPQILNEVVEAALGYSVCEVDNHPASISLVFSTDDDIVNAPHACGPCLLVLTVVLIR